MPRKKSSAGLLSQAKTAGKVVDLVGALKQSLDKQVAPPLHGGSGRSKASPPLFVLLSDLHAHPWAAFAKGDGAQNTRLRSALRILDASLAKAQELDVPWVFAGDIVHTAGYSLNVVLAELTTILLRYPDVMKLAVWGNHDARGIGGRITLDQTVLSSLGQTIPRLMVLDPSIATEPYQDPKSGLTFSGAGYQPRREFLEYGQPADIGVYHQTIQKTKAPSGFVLDEGIPAQDLLDRHRIVVVGHVHHWQYHPAAKEMAGNKVLLIPGSPEYQNFGDAGEHGWWVMGKDSETFVPGGSPEFRTVDTPEQVKVGDGHFYRVRRAPAGSELPSGAVAVAPSPQSIEQRDLLHGARGVHTVDVWLKEKPPEAELPLPRFAEAGRQLLWEQDVGTLRPVRLTHLMLHNFCSYDQQEFPVQPGTWLVVGQGRDFPSNGSGKSSLFEAIRWLLFGTTTKGLSGDEVIRWGTDECEVAATLVDEVTGAWTRVSRKRGKSSTLEVEHQATGPVEAKSVNEMTEKLLKFLGLTPALHQALGYFSQEKLLLFASSTDGERKDMLADLIGLQMYQEASSRALKRCQECEASEGQLVALRDAAERRVKSEQQRLSENQSKEEAWAGAHLQRQDAARDAAAKFEKGAPQLLEKLLQEARTARSAAITKRLERFQQEQGALAAKREAASLLDVHSEAELKVAKAHSTQVSSDATKFAGSIAEVVRQLESYKKKLAAQQLQLEQGQCPACGQEITEDHRDQCLQPLRDEITAAEEQLSRMRHDQKHVLATAVQAKSEMDRMAAGVAAGAELRRLDAEEQRLVAEQEEIAHSQAEVDANAQEFAEQEIERKRAEFARVAKQIAAEANPYARESAATEKRIQESEAEVEVLTAKRKTTLEDLAIHDYWRRGFSKQGIQSLLVDEVAVIFNDARGAIFPALTQGVYDAQFSTVSQTKAGDSRERTEFQVFEHGQPVQYEALSGGQRRRIDVGVMLTLVKAVSRWMQTPGVLGMLVLDEVCGFLDASGAEGLMEAIREVQEQIPTIFVVTHDTQLQALFPEVIVVQQDQQGVSHIVAQGGDN